jgi:predicted aspartyl protease
MRDGPNDIRGLGLELRINGGRPARLLLDTGASGVFVRQSVVDKAHLTHIGADETWGVGDDGKRNTFDTVADTCQIGALKYKACVIESMEGKGRIAGDEDGLIGPDVFSDYLVEIDFQKKQMHLTPLPERKPIPQEYDRVLDANGPDFTPVFRLGDHLFVPTTVNSKRRGLFLIDTGSSMSFIDSRFARQSTKIHNDHYTQVTGISGRVKDVFEGDKAVIEFAHYRQTNLDFTALDLNQSPEHQELRMAGILGFPVLAMFRLTLDYRNGLVKFDYVKH